MSLTKFLLCLAQLNSVAKMNQNHDLLQNHLLTKDCSKKMVSSRLKEPRIYRAGVQDIEEEHLKCWRAESVR